MYYTIFLCCCSSQEWSIHPLIPFRPVVEKGDDTFLPASPSELMRNQSAVPWITGITSEEGALAASSKKPQLPEFVTNLICNPDRNTTGRSVTRLWADSILSRSRNLSRPKGNRTVFGGCIASCAMDIELFLQEQSD
jgi:hypothetical protein